MRSGNWFVGKMMLLGDMGPTLRKFLSTLRRKFYWQACYCVSADEETNELREGIANLVEVVPVVKSVIVYEEKKMKDFSQCRKCGCDITFQEYWTSGGMCYLCALPRSTRCEAFDENQLGLRGYERKETL